MFSLKGIYVFPLIVASYETGGKYNYYIAVNIK